MKLFLYLRNLLIPFSIRYAAAFGLGVLTCFTSYRFHFFKFEEKINLVEAVAIFVNIFLTIYISRILEKRKTEDRVEKEIVIDKIKEIILLSKLIVIENNGLNFSLATNTFRQLSMELNILEKVINYLNFNLDESQLIEIKKFLKNFKKLVTDRKVENNILLFDFVSGNRVAITSRDFRFFLSTLIINCNRV